MTAAHCTTTGTITGVVLGRYDLDSMTDYDYETMAVIDVVLHPGWDPIIVSNDVALLILERNSRHPYVTINRDWDVPTQGEHLVVMGELTLTMHRWIFRFFYLFGMDVEGKMIFLYCIYSHVYLLFHPPPAFCHLKLVRSPRLGRHRPT